MATINPDEAKPYVPGAGGGTVIPIQLSPPPGTAPSGDAGAGVPPVAPGEPLVPPPVTANRPRSLSEVRTSGETIKPDVTSSIEQQKIDSYNANIQAEQVSVAALASQYDNLIKSLQGQYRFAETAEEKQRLKYMLADIEAQYDAARQTITQTYDLSMANLRGRIGTEQQQVTDFAQRGGEAFTNLANELELRTAGVSNELAEKFQGIGLEKEATVANEWSNLLRSMAPIQGSYLLQLGNVRINSMNQTLDSMAMEAMAQQGELERQKATTQSITQLRYLEQVEDRINRELADYRDRKVGIEMTKIAQTQSALEFNARMSQDARNRMQTAADPRERYNAFTQYARGEGASMVDPQLFERQFIAASGGERPDNNIWWAYLEEATKTAEELLALATRARTDTYNSLARNMVIDPDTGSWLITEGSYLRKVYQDDLAQVEREYLESLSQYRQFENLLREIAPYSYTEPNRR
jgi:hypothetical protein